MQDQNSGNPSEKKSRTVNITGNSGGVINYKGTIGGSVVVGAKGPVHIGNTTTTTVYNHSASGAQQINLADQFKQRLGNEFLAKNYFFSITTAEDSIDICLVGGNPKAAKADAEKLKTTLLQLLSISKKIEASVFQNRVSLEIDTNQQQKIIDLIKQAGFKHEVEEQPAEGLSM